jgi:hypothetical protein
MDNRDTETRVSNAPNHRCSLSNQNVELFFGRRYETDRVTFLLVINGNELLPTALEGGREAGRQEGRKQKSFKHELLVQRVSHI